MTIAEYKAELTREFMNSADAAALYGFEVGSDFYSHFSKVSVESVLFGVVAMRDYVMARLFDTYKSEVSRMIEAIMPHRPKWYVDKTLAFMYNCELVLDTDKYDTTGMSDGDINKAKVVKHAVAVENATASILTIKVAGEKNGERVALDADAEVMLQAYLAEIKDAGVRIELVNREADKMTCYLKIHYNVQKAPETVQELCEEVVKSYVENLPFNGRYTNQMLVDKLQATDGVELVEVISVAADDGLGDGYREINAYATPVAGYYYAEVVELTMEPYYN